MDYKTTYTYFFKTTQRRLTYILQSYLHKAKGSDRPFNYADKQIEQYYSKKLETLKNKWNYDKLKPIIDLIGLKNSYYEKHALSRILSNEIKNEFQKLNLETPYKFFLAQLAQLQAIEEGHINYSNNRTYYDRCFKTDGIENISIFEIENGYNNLDDFHARGKKLNMDQNDGIFITANSQKKPVKDSLKNALSEDEKVTVLQVLFDSNVPINKLLTAPEFYRLCYLSSELFDDRIINEKLANYSVYRKLGQHINISKNTERKKIEELIRKLEKLKVISFLPELRKLLLKTT